jgi:hypothetical protein
MKFIGQALSSINYFLTRQVFYRKILSQVFAFNLVLTQKEVRIVKNLCDTIVEDCQYLPIVHPLFFYFLTTYHCIKAFCLK